MDFRLIELTDSAIRESRLDIRTWHLDFPPALRIMSTELANTFSLSNGATLPWQQ